MNHMTWEQYTEGLGSLTPGKSKKYLLGPPFCFVATHLLAFTSTYSQATLCRPGVTAPGHALYGDQGDSILLATTLQTCLLPFYTLDSCSLSFAPPNIFGRHASWEPKGKTKARKSFLFCSIKFWFILLHMKLMKESKGSNPGSG